MQSKKPGFCFAPFFKHFRVRKMCGASVHRSTRLLKIVFQQPGSLGHSNRKSFDAIPEAQLAELGLSRNPKEILGAGKFMIPQSEEFESAMNKEFEQIKAGF